ncbi:MAG: threonine--tRNA ligase [Hydrogenothermaceae bacterium]|nr:threonine--tRNA ligase [Hydrogenothermaceae bacterium]
MDDNFINITLPDGTVKQFPKGVTSFEIASSLSKKLAEEALAALVNDKVKELEVPINEDAIVKILTFEDELGKEVYWHSSSHLMAHAIEELFPGAKFGVGPAIENGFYYDILVDRKLTQDDLKQIELKMYELSKANKPFIRKECGVKEAIEFFTEKGDPFKVELLKELENKPDEIISIYEEGSFTDLCRGPHLPSTGKIRFVKLLNISGSYWRGDSKNIPLQRIYGISFPKKKELDDYLNLLEEAKKRDHRKIGKELELFLIDEEVGGGLAIWLPKGAIIRKLIEDYWKDEHLKRGYQLVYTPHVGKETLWQTSGHLSFYQENMYPRMQVEEEGYYVKPMNCPFHVEIYKSKQRSYKELPIRLAELGTVYRYERSGALHGLMRVRGFTQDDAHIICREDQVEEEIKNVLHLAIDTLKSYGFDEFDVFLSTRPEKSVGDDRMWGIATNSLRKAIESVGLEYKIDEGGGAFYGPKIDIKIKDAIGRFWQCSTIQFDFNLPERFDMYYIGEDNTKHRPYMVHRAIFGSIERFIGVLIEHYAGFLPVWLAPVQAKIIPIADKHIDYANKLKSIMVSEGIRVEVDDRSERMNKKIRDAEIQKIPYMLVVGDKEVETESVSVREKGKQGSYSLTFSEFLNKIKSVINNKEKI